MIAIKERDNLIQQARDNGAYFLDALKQALEPHADRRRGAWQRDVARRRLTRDKQTKEPFEDDTVQAIVRRAYNNGVIVSAIGTAFEIAPPLDHDTRRTSINDRSAAAGGQ